MSLFYKIYGSKFNFPFPNILFMATSTHFSPINNQTQIM